MTAATATRPKATDEKSAGSAKPVKKSLLKSKKGLIIIVVLLAAIGYAAYTFLAPPGKPAPPAGGDIVPMEATTLNLQGGHYLKLAVAIQLVEGKATTEDFKTSEAAELVIDEFSDRTVEAVSSNEARKKLTAELEAKIKAAYEGEVFDVFLTQFVTQ